MRFLKSMFLIAALLANGHLRAHAEPPDFAPRFADHMVLQHSAPVLIEGVASPGESVSLSLGSQSARVITGPDGRWSVSLDGQSPARRLTLAAATSQGVALRHDILLGDVFLCSGQSNMAFPVETALNPGTELNGPFPSEMRLLKVPQQTSVKTQTMLAAGSIWRPANHDTVSDFSAICYFFGRDHAVRTGLPVGLIDSSWGGSRIEAWISSGELATDPALAEALDLLAQYSANPAAAHERYGRSWEGWWTAQAAGYAPWQTGLAASRPVPGILRDWKDFGDPELDEHLGLVWFERTFTLEADDVAGSGLLSLGAMDEIDAVWVNGAFAGTSFGWGTPRTYFLPQGMLKAGTNRIVVGVHNSWGAGGMTGPEDALRLVLHERGEIPLKGSWTYEMASSAFGTPPLPPWQSISGLSGLHNAMIAPLAGLRLAGALWYQGESNVGEPERYENLLGHLAADLRRQFGENLPLIVFQLPEFGPLAYEAGKSDWSSLREAQRRFVMSDAASGLVVTLGTGEPTDIHPPNKQEPARRAGAVWPAINSASPERTGHSPQNAVRTGNAITIALPQTRERFGIAGSDDPIGFSVCMTDGTCRFTRPRLADHSLIFPKEDRQAVRVRYCWGDTPICNLMTPGGVPVTPFELKLP